MLPFEEEPLLMVIPPSPEFATVKSSALLFPAEVVPINNLPSESSIFPPDLNLV